MQSDLISDSNILSLFDKHVINGIFMSTGS